MLGFASMQLQKRSHEFDYLSFFNDEVTSNTDIKNINTDEHLTENVSFVTCEGEL